MTASDRSAAARRVTTLDRGILLLRIEVPLHAVAGMGAGESPSVRGDAPSPFGGDAPPDEVPLLRRAKIQLVMLPQAKMQRVEGSLFL